jgi:hypothetical protein
LAAAMKKAARRASRRRRGQKRTCKFHRLANERRNHA